MILGAVAVLLFFLIYKARKNREPIRNVRPLIILLVIVIVTIWIINIYNGFFKEGV